MLEVASKANTDTNNAAQELSDATVDFFDKYTENLKLNMQRLENEINNAGNSSKNRISEIDAIIASRNDERRGGMSGVSDVAISRLEDEKKLQQTKILSEQLTKYEELMPLLESYRATQKRIADEAQQAAKDSEGTKNEGAAVKAALEAKRDVIDAEQKIIDLTNKRTQTQAELNAALGIASVAEQSLTDDIAYSISNWVRLQEVQNGFRRNLEQNITKVLNDASSAFSDFVVNVASGTESVGQSFRKMAQSIIKSMLDIAARSAATSAMGGLMSLLGPIITGIVGGGQVYDSAIGPTQTINTNTGFYGMNSGGFVRPFSSGGRNALSTRDSINARLRPGEYVLRNSAVDMIGRENLDRINAAGNTRASTSLGTVAGASTGANDNGNSVVNVYVMSPEAKPSLTKNDVIVTIGEDVAKGGQTIKLIKQVMAGRS
jgi:phage-related minor tail protein